MSKRYVLGPAGARKLRALFNGRGVSGSVRGDAVPLALEDEFALPYEVKWAQSAASGEGSWIIWLPSDKLVVLPSGTVNPAASLTAAGGDYPVGWYVLTDAMLDRDEGGTLYLNVTLGDSPSAVFSSSAAADSADEFDVPICSASVNSETGERTVKQFVTSAIALGGSGGDAPTPFMLGTWKRDAEQGETGDAQGKVTVAGIVNGVFYWDGELQTVDNFPTPSGQATVYLRCVGTKSSSAASGYSWVFSLGTSPASSEESDTVCKSFKLYDFDGGAVAMDYRDTFLAIASGTAEKIEPDGASLDFVPAAAEGEEPDGDEGKLEVKGFKAAAAGKVPYKSGNVIVWGGKAIASVTVVPGQTSQVLTLYYTDGTYTAIEIPHGLNGGKGDKGDDGDTPEITATRNDGNVNIYADGNLIATLSDGRTPVITATKSQGVTTIFVDGVAVAQVEDGAAGAPDLPNIDAVTGASFAISNGKLVCTLTKENLKTGATSNSTSEVCDVGELDVVVSEAYSHITHQFTNTRKRVKVLGTPVDATGQTPFTATPLSGE